MDNFSAERLANEDRAFRQIIGTWLCLARGDENFDVRPALSTFAGERKAISASGHLHVREQELDLVRRILKYRDRIVTIACLVRPETGVEQNIGGIHTDQRVIVDDKSMWRSVVRHDDILGLRHAKR
jgi:hypothetical protein